MSPRAFVIAVGVVAVLTGIFLGMNRFSASVSNLDAVCFSYFEGRGGVLNFEHPGNYYSPGADELEVKCESKRETFGIFTWALIAGGAVAVAGGGLVRVSKPAAT